MVQCEILQIVGLPVGTWMVRWEGGEWVVNEIGGGWSVGLRASSE